MASKNFLAQIFYNFTKPNIKNFMKVNLIKIIEKLIYL